MKAVLDANVYVDFVMDRPDVVDLYSRAKHGNTEILLPAVVMGELFYGYMKGTRTRYNEEKFHRFVTELEVSIIRADEEVARKYAVFYSALTNNRARIPINDVWTAACCMSAGGTLLTRDRHFQKVAQIDKIILN